jgi:methylmalonyl-CoA mutase N-terminal domain/subunit
VLGGCQSLRAPHAAGDRVRVGRGQHHRPARRSYAVEALTDELERRARDYLERIDQIGGAVKAIEQGFMQREIDAAAYRYQQEIERKERIIVGVNEFTSKTEVPPPLLRIDPAFERTQRERLAALRARRDNAKVEAALARVEATARGTDNLLPAILDAVRAYATVGEISDAMRKVFGQYRPTFVG